MQAKQRSRGRPAGRGRIGAPAALVLVVGTATTVLLFALALVSVHDSERSLLREHTAPDVRRDPDRRPADRGDRASGAPRRPSTRTATRGRSGEPSERASRPASSPNLSLLRLRPASRDPRSRGSAEPPSGSCRRLDAGRAGAARAVARTGARHHVHRRAGPRPERPRRQVRDCRRAGSKLIVYGEIAGERHARRAGGRRRDERPPLRDLPRQATATNAAAREPDGIPTGHVTERRPDRRHAVPGHPRAAPPARQRLHLGRPVAPAGARPRRDDRDRRAPRARPPPPRRGARPRRRPRAADARAGPGARRAAARRAAGARRRRAAAPRPADGGGRPARGRRRARLQQPADRDHRQHRAPAPRHASPATPRAAGSRTSSAPPTARPR